MRFRTDAGQARSRSRRLLAEKVPSLALAARVMLMHRSAGDDLEAGLDHPAVEASGDRAVNQTDRYRRRKVNSRRKITHLHLHQGFEALTLPWRYNLMV